MKLLLLLFIGALATPAQANLQQNFQTQQQERNVIEQRRTELCNNHLRQAQFKQTKQARFPLQNWETYYRVSRGDLYVISWYGTENNGPLRPKPCSVRLVPFNQDFHPESIGGRPARGSQRYVVEGNQLVRYSNALSLSFNPENPNPRVERVVVGVKR
jgi:hypothetical protein